MNKPWIRFALIGVASSITACANMTPQQKTVVTAIVIGVTVGAIVASQSGGNDDDNDGIIVGPY